MRWSTGDELKKKNWKIFPQWVRKLAGGIRGRNLGIPVEKKSGCILVLSLPLEA